MGNAGGNGGNPMGGGPAEDHDFFNVIGREGHPLNFLS